MATLAEPLYRLFKQDAPLRWGKVEADVMESLKTALTSPPLIPLPDFDKDFFLRTDASDCGIGAVLSQLDKDNKEHPVYYDSRTLHPAERNYSTSERECLAVKWTCDLFRPYLLGRPFSFTRITLRFSLAVSDEGPQVEVGSLDPCSAGRLAATNLSL